MTAAKRARKKENLKLKRQRIADLKIAAETQELLDRAAARKAAKKAAAEGDQEPVLESEHAAAKTAKGAVDRLRSKFRKA